MKIWLRGLFLCLQLSPYFLFSATMHVLLVGDTCAMELKTAIENDLRKMKNELRTAASQSGLHYKEIEISGVKATPEGVLAAAESIRLSADDTAVFYFAGHGYRFKSKRRSPWPYLCLTRPFQGVDLDDLIDIYREKNPRLLLMIADCCNNVLPEQTAPVPVLREWIEKKLPKNSKVNYRRLFAESNLEMIISASRKGEVAWCIPKGNIYTLAFLNHLKKELKKVPEDVSWENILKGAELESKQHQNPYYIIH